MSRKSAVVSLRRTDQRAELVPCRLSVVHYDYRNTGGDAALQTCKTGADALWSGSRIAGLSFSERTVIFFSVFILTLTLRQLLSLIPERDLPYPARKFLRAARNQNRSGGQTQEGVSAQSGL